MLIDNKTNRYPDSGFNIVTVWDFINEFSGKSSEQVGNMDIVTGYFTIRALSKLYHELPEEDVEDGVLLFAFCVALIASLHFKHKVIMP